ncbi:hypothetical protein [Pedobacter frigiditerrae]|uniref:hypothetical protein n=1 Tax=Pedobacter frigiditerrae TaxID=2530452 RepID=UPI00292CCB25|nr:hypothetical protein [Pedobacter frigiditerrae]
METNENIAGLGKNHDKAAHEHDIAKKQSEAQPAAENLDMMPHSVNKDGNKDFKENADTDKVANVHNEAAEYAQKEHEKADNWENTNESGPNKPTF